MSQNSSTTVDESLPRNDNQQGQNGMGDQGGLMNPLANPIPRPPSLPIGRRTLVIQDQNEIVSTLSSLSRFYRQTIFVLKARGYVSEATVVTYPSGNLLNCNVRGRLLYLNGWFNPMITEELRTLPRSRNNGVLNVSISSVPHGLALAVKLFPSGSVEVEVLIASRPQSIIQPDAPAGGQGEPNRGRLIVIPIPQPPVTDLRL